MVLDSPVIYKQTKCYLTCGWNGKLSLKQLALGLGPHEGSAESCAYTDVTLFLLHSTPALHPCCCALLGWGALTQAFTTEGAFPHREQANSVNEDKL